MLGWPIFQLEQLSLRRIAAWLLMMIVLKLFAEVVVVVMTFALVVASKVVATAAFLHSDHSRRQR